jgi:hypothetical protein
MTQELIQVFERGTLSAIRTWNVFESVLAHHHLVPASFEIYGESVAAEHVTDRLAERRKDTFLVEGGGFALHQGTVSNYLQSFVRVVDDVGERIPWTEWCLTLCSVGQLVMAWVVDSEYDFWQNAEDPLQYETRGRSYSHLPMRSNGLPPPLEQKVIDISPNPGRRVLRKGYVEAVGGTMWLTDRFWAVTSTSKAKVLEADWLLVREVDGNLEVRASSQPFQSGEGESKIVQDRLRALLFD